MKILIYGEYSGYGKSLAAGFRSLGHEASVFSPNGDGWKKIDSDFSLLSKSKIGKIKELLWLIPVFLRFDVVLIMNPSFFSFKLLGPVMLLLFKIKRINMFLLCCGDDVEYIRAGDAGVLKKFVFEGVDYPHKNYFKSLSDRVVHYLCATAVNKIIPVMYDYYLPWRTSKYSRKLTRVIPLACDAVVVSEVKKTDLNCIKIMHGINRREVKGSPSILAALNKIKSEFDNVEIYTPEKISQSDYLELLSRVDISIDQCKCHSYGMNAIYAMYSGHVVLAPADHLHCESFGVNSTPIVSISNDESDIYTKLSEILKHSDKIDETKEKTLAYACLFHSPIVVCSLILAEI